MKLLYLFIAVVCVEALLWALFTYINKQQLADKEHRLILSPPRFRIFIIPAVFIPAVPVFVRWFGFDSELNSLAAIVSISVILLFVFNSRFFVWLHFYDDKIVARYPLTKSTVEIPLWKIKQASIFRGKNMWLHIEHFESAEIRKYSFMLAPNYDAKAVRDYFLSHHLHYID